MNKKKKPNLTKAIANNLATTVNHPLLNSSDVEVKKDFNTVISESVELMDEIGSAITIFKTNLNSVNARAKTSLEKLKEVNKFFQQEI